MGVWNREIRDKMEAQRLKTRGLSAIMTDSEYNAYCMAGGGNSLEDIHRAITLALSERRGEPAPKPKDMLCIQPDGSVHPVVSLRDQFAMAALTGVLCGNKEMIESGECSRKEIALVSWAIADAMLKAREGKE